MKHDQIELIKIILREADIFNLIKEGAPHDEYNLEAPKILKLLEMSENIDLFTDGIYNLYSELFNFSRNLINKDKIIKLAEKLFRLKNQKNKITK